MSYSTMNEMEELLPRGMSLQLTAFINRELYHLK